MARGVLAAPSTSRAGWKEAAAGQGSKGGRGMGWVGRQAIRRGHKYTQPQEEGRPVVRDTRAAGHATHVEPPSPPDVPVLGGSARRQRQRLQTQVGDELHRCRTVADGSVSENTPSQEGEGGKRGALRCRRRPSEPIGAVRTHLMPRQPFSNSMPPRGRLVHSHPPSRLEASMIVMAAPGSRRLQGKAAHCTRTRDAGCAVPPRRACPTAAGGLTGCCTRQPGRRCRRPRPRRASLGSAVPPKLRPPWCPADRNSCAKTVSPSAISVCKRNVEDVQRQHVARATAFYTKIFSVTVGHRGYSVVGSTQDCVLQS